MKGSKSLSALAVVVLFSLSVLLPMFLISSVVVNEATLIISNLPEHINNPPEGIKKMLRFSDKHFHIPKKAIRREMVKQIYSIEAYALKSSAQFMSGTIKLAANILVFVTALFCFLRDGKSLTVLIADTLPLKKPQTIYILGRLIRLSKSVIKGMFLNAIAVAIISIPGFFIAGLSLPLWCLAVSIGILIPVIGSLTVWTSAAAVLLVTAGFKSAFFIACYGIVVIGVCDNILGPYLMRGSEEISPIWILFSILGGIHLTGIPGIVIGPVLLAAAFAFFDVYRSDYKLV